VGNRNLQFSICDLRLVRKFFGQVTCSAASFSISEFNATYRTRSVERFQKSVASPNGTVKPSKIDVVSRTRSGQASKKSVASGTRNDRLAKKSVVSCSVFGLSENQIRFISY